MSLQSIGHFQKAIYETLKTDQRLMQMVAGVYLSVQQDAKYPFVLVSLISLQDMSKYSKKIYEIDFEIALFTRDRIQEPILKVAEHISNLMESQSVGIADANLVSMRKNTIEWVRGQDGMSSKLVMKYKGMVSGRGEGVMHT